MSIERKIYERQICEKGLVMYYYEWVSSRQHTTPGQWLSCLL